MRPNSQRRTVAPARPLNTQVRRRELSKRALDIGLAGALLILVAPVVLLIAIAVKIDSRGPILYRSRRAGLRGAEFAMLKFRKMYDGAVGSALTAADDSRLTRVGRVLARTKLDEIPQLLNVLRGQMSLVGPRPEDPRFVKLEPDRYRTILRVRPGITGLSQLAFARESEILDPSDQVGHYVRAIFPQKVAIDALYVTSWSIRMDLSILAWTGLAVVARRNVAVNRATGGLTLRHRKPAPSSVVETSQAA